MSKPIHETVFAEVNGDKLMCMSTTSEIHAFIARHKLNDAGVNALLELSQSFDTLCDTKHTKPARDTRTTRATRTRKGGSC